MNRFSPHRVAAALLTTLLSVAPAHAIDEYNATLFGDFAIGGYDAVAYFKKGDATEGSKAYTMRWKGAVWCFSSEKHLAAFEKAPEKYAPQFGGYCAWAVAHGYTADIDPQAWKIVKGKLYLNYSLSIQKKWLQDPKKYIAQGDTNWARMRRQ